MPNPKDSSNINWLEQAAQNGDSGAMNKLAIHYKNGKRIQKNPFVGIKMLQKKIILMHNLILKMHMKMVMEL